MKKLFLTLAVLFLLILLNACESKKFVTGLEDEIYVVADSIEYSEIYDALAQTFEIEINTPQPEKIFTLKRISPSEINRIQRKKNIIIVAPLNSGSKTSEFINSIVDDSVKKLLSNEDFYVTKYDLWARNQLVSVISANGMQELEFKILKNKDKLLYAYQKISDERLKESLYSEKYERKEIEGKLLKDYGWIIYVQADFKLAKSVPEDNFVWLRRAPGSDMERWIFVHWIDNASPEYLNVDSIKAIRNRITKKYYRTSDDSAYVIIAQDYFVSNEVNFNGRYAIFTQGLWDLNIKGMGGPFINYTFYDEKSKRIYMLDGSVYAPKYFKRNLIQQMDVLLQSFMTKDELSKDRIEDLLNSVDESVKY